MCLKTTLKLMFYAYYSLHAEHKMRRSNSYRQNAQITEIDDDLNNTISNVINRFTNSRSNVRQLRAIR